MEIDVAVLERVIKLARMADPANNASETERSVAARQILKSVSEAMASAPKAASGSSGPPPGGASGGSYGGASGGSSGGSNGGSNSGSSGGSSGPYGPPWPGVNARKIMERATGRAMVEPELSMLRDFVARLGAIEVENIAEYVIRKEASPNGRWTYFANICRKKIREMV